MNPERRRRVEELFLSALDRSPTGRDEYLAAACDDAELRATVRTLLDQDAAAAAWFADLADRAGHLLDTLPDPDALAGRRVGAFVLEREIGRGGTSVVYAARRVEGAFEQTAAVKVLARRSGGADLRDGFEREQRVLSGLAHPGIATIYDGGVTDDGYPFFVMELVEGTPLGRYCDEARLTVDERLRLFLTVIDAVHHAHGNLVIHRDLKPSNILVTGGGAVKLIDFGIARVLPAGAPGADDATTRIMARWLTPEYGAPEQVRGERTTTATDIYQLGVVLYEILTGRLPIPADSADSPYLVGKAVCETEPPRPSRAVTRPGVRRRDGTATPLTPSAVAQARRTEVRQLKDRLRGDVDAIVLRSLRKDPAQRYVSAEALARDIRRYLEGKPVEAREGKLPYRARKFVVRHRVPVAAAVLTLLLLAGGGALYNMRMAEQRDLARLEAARAKTVTGFVLDLFRASHAEEARGEALTAASLLERGIERADVLANQPAVQAEMLATVARGYHGLADYDSADRLFTRSLEIRRAHLGRGHPDVANSLAHLAWNRLVLREFDSAAALFRDALAIQRDALGHAHPEVANSLTGLGLALNGLGRTSAAIGLLEEAQDIRDATFAGRPHVETANGLNDLAILVRESGDLERAERLLVEALTMRRALLPESHPDVAKSAQHLASLLHAAGRYDAAEPLYLEALESWTKSLGPAHPFTLSTVRSLASLYHHWGRPDDAARFDAPPPTEPR